jgi:hypothetical protein
MRRSFIPKLKASLSIIRQPLDLNCHSPASGITRDVAPHDASHR